FVFFLFPLERTGVDRRKVEDGAVEAPWLERLSEHGASDNRSGRHGLIARGGFLFGRRARAVARSCPGCPGIADQGEEHEDGGEDAATENNSTHGPPC